MNDNALKGDGRRRGVWGAAKGGDVARGGDECDGHFREGAADEASMLILVMTRVSADLAGAE
jgi:hypothetical protein